ncbi:MAG: T9SS type A sorting domain-containing protein, partial [Cytophagales bacterium]|nr:T9SS type A sorting domain-containing protein [Cytophagales bacterium]
SVTLTASPAVSYLWSTSAITQSIIVSTPGSYTVTVTDVNGCSSTSAPTSVTVNPNPAAPIISPGGPTTFCQGGSVTLTSSAANSYLWSTSATTQSIIVSTGGSYTVTISDINGCSATSAPTSVTVNPNPTPIVTASGPITFCDGNSVILTSSAAASYSWSTGAATQSITVSVSGSYSVTVTDGNGCSGTSAPTSVTVNPNPAAPIISAGGPATFCQGDSVTLTSSAAFSYLWSTSATTQSINVTASGSYTVTITDINGCSAASAPTSVTVNPNPAVPVITTSGPTSFCVGDSITLTSSPENSYLWSTGAAAQSITVSTNGSYSVTVTDINSCSSTSAPTSVTVNPLPTAVLSSSTNVSCNGGSDGTATVNASGGTSPYSYNWSSGGIDTTETGLSAGITYSVIVTDTNGCTDSDSVTLTEPAALLLTTGSVDATCGAADGQASVFVTGGTGPYTYLWNDTSAQTTDTATGLPAGSYTVTVTDTSSCTSNAVISVNDAGAPTAIITSTTNATCGDTCDGDATVSVTGGAPPYTYVWSDSLAQTDSIATGLCAGNFSVTITDTAGCVATSNITITAPPLLTAIIASKVDISCNGAGDGSAAVGVTGGIGSYTYLWDDPSAQTTIAASNLISGIYTVIVTDSINCTVTTGDTINEPALISLTDTSTDATCGNADGSATVTATGGTGGYTWLWSTGGTAATDSNLASGIYNVTVTDANGCTASSTVAVNDIGAPTVSISSGNDVTCNGACDGDATISAAGGSPPYAYLWDDGQIDSIAIGLCAGTYNVIVTDTNGCSSVASITIGEPTAISLITSSTDASCGFADGSATVTATGGTGGYSYLWSSGSTAATDSNLTSGVYTVTVTDTNGCTASATVAVNDIGAPAVNISSSTNLLCNGDCNGDATVSATGGTPPYTWLWDDGQADSTATGLCAGTYNVTVTDASGCNSIVNVTINQPPAISLTTLSTDATCGNADGSATVTATGGTGGYTWLWSTGGTAATDSNLASGIYNVIVTDANGCTTSSTVVVNNIGAPTVSISSSADATCNGSCDGDATVSVTGGTPPYTYLWNDGQIDSTAIALCAGTYNVTVTDSNVCNSIVNVTITEPTAISLTTASTDATCGNADGSATVTATGGTGGYTYLWSSGGTGATESNLTSGIYTITVTDVNSCTTTTSVTVNEPAAPTASISTSNDVLCNGDCNGNATVSATGGAAPYIYLWDDGQTDSTATGLCAGTNNVTVTDTNGCSAAGVNVTINEPAALLLSTDSTDATSGNCDGSATVTATGGTGGYSYLWDASTGNQTTQTATGLCAGTYNVTVTDGNGCTATDTITVVEPTGIVDIDFVNSINIYPNPNLGEFSIEMEISQVEDIQVKIISLTGRKKEVYYEKLSQFTGTYRKQINLDKFAKGVYQLQVITTYGTVNRKVILE